MSYTLCLGTYLILLVIYCLLSIMLLKDWEINYRVERNFDGIKINKNLNFSFFIREMQWFMSCM